MTVPEASVRIEDAIREFILTEVGFDGPREKLSDDARLLDDGILDSPALFHIISFLEDEYDVEVADEELSVDNFASIGSIANLTRSKL